MTLTNIETTPPYKVLIGSDILKDCASYIKEILPVSTAVIISDETVYPLYGDVVKLSLEQSGYKVVQYTFPAGESSKNMNTVCGILEFMAQHKVSHSDIIIALGGGVVGDIAGFCAAVYLRGISFVQIPTTLLAAVDSSVGGKTGVNLSVGKNLAGAFKQPRLVLCDTDTFKTLEHEIVKDGICEIVKYACILDSELFTKLETEDFNENIPSIVKRCVELKAKVVKEDEFDTGIRQILNFGHTIGHAIEKLSSYDISHGKAVGVGMYVIEKANNSPHAERIKALLTRFDIDTQCDYTAKELAKVATSDKKVRGGNINLILLKEIGEAVISPTDVKIMESFFEKGM